MRCRSKRTRTKPSGATAEAALIAFEVDGDARRGDRSYIFPDLDVVGMRPVRFEIGERIEPGDEREIVGCACMQHVGSGGDRADFRDQRGKTFEFFFDKLADGAMRRADFRFRLEFPGDEMGNHDKWLLFFLIVPALDALEYSARMVKGIFLRSHRRFKYESGRNKATYSEW